MVYVGVSAGSMVVSPYIGETYGRKPPSGSDIDFTLFPHLNDEAKPDASLANVRTWAAKVPVPMYGIDRHQSHRRNRRSRF